MNEKGSAGLWFNEQRHGIDFDRCSKRRRKQKAQDRLDTRRVSRRNRTRQRHVEPIFFPDVRISVSTEIGALSFGEPLWIPARDLVLGQWRT